MTIHDEYSNISDSRKRWEKRHPEKARQIRNRASLRQIQKMRLCVIQLLGNKCVKCGFSDIRVLQIDHINGNGSKEYHIIGPYSYYSLVINKIKSGSKDYQLLCANCNWIKKYENKEVKKLKILGK